jgi:chloramphenicol-sensitive protein RarD
VGGLVHDDAQQLRSGIIAGLAAYLTWGALTLYWKQLHEFNPFELVGWRIISASLIMASILTVTGRWARLRPVLQSRALLGRVVLAALLLTVNWCTYVFAVVNDHVIETALGYFMSPLGTMAVGVLVFHERLSRMQRIAVALAVIAVVLLTITYGRFPVIALLLARSRTSLDACWRRAETTTSHSLPVFLGSASSAMGRQASPSFWNHDQGGK